MSVAWTGPSQTDTVCSPAPEQTRWQRWKAAREQSGSHRTQIWLTSEGRETLDRALKRTGLSLGAFVERAAERELTQRVPDAPFAQYIPRDIRSQSAVRELFQYGLDLAAATAAALKEEMRRARRAHPEDRVRNLDMRARVDLAYCWLALVQDMDADASLREHTFQPDIDEQGRNVGGLNPEGREVRHRFKSEKSSNSVEGTQAP